MASRSSRTERNGSARRSRRLGTRPPSSLVLAHGAGSGPWVFDGWPECFPGVTVEAVDLLEGLDVACASHADYAEAVVRSARSLPGPVSLLGWSMGGLAALQAAEEVKPHSVILVETSPPAEVQGFDESVEVEDGAFDPEEVYGAFPPGMKARPESLRARGERKRGISVPSLPCPSLVVYGDEFRDKRGPPVAALYGSDELDSPGYDHWELVRDPSVREAIARWLAVSERAAIAEDVPNPRARSSARTRSRPDLRSDNPPR